MRRLASTASSLLADASLAKVHPVLKAVAGRAAPQVKDTAEATADAQEAADLLGFAATNCSENSYFRESEALRLAAGAALEDLVESVLEPMMRLDGPGMVTDEGEVPRIAPDRLIPAMDQLIIRCLEHLPGPDPPKAWHYAQQACMWSRRHQLWREARRFSAAARQILLQCPDAATSTEAKASCKRRRLEKGSLPLDAVEAHVSQTDPDEQLVQMNQATSDVVDVCMAFLSVDRLDCLTEDAFKHYSELRKPVVARCPVGTFPVLDTRKLVDLCRDRELQIMEHDPGSKVWAKMARAQGGEQTLEAVLTGWAAGRKRVLFDHPLEAACPALASKLRWPSFLGSSDLIGQSPFAGLRGEDPFWDHPSLFVQPQGSQCGVHVDGADSQFIQLVLLGRKRWSFWPLPATEHFTHLKRQDRLQLEVWQSGSGSFQHQIRHDQLFPEMLPETWRVDVEVEAGEMIVVPGGVPHMVTNLQDCIAVSRNFIDTYHAQSCADALRWPLPYHELADFLEQRSLPNEGKRILIS